MRLLLVQTSRNLYVSISDTRCFREKSRQRLTPIWVCSPHDQHCSHSTTIIVATSSLSGLQNRNLRPLLTIALLKRFFLYTRSAKINGSGRRQIDHWTQTTTKPSTMTNETTQLIVQDNFDGESYGSVNSLSRFESFHASARSITNSVSQSMKRIGILGSVAIAANSLTGPAMLCLPATYQRSGLIPTTGTRRKSWIDDSGCRPLSWISYLSAFWSLSHSFAPFDASKLTVVIIFVCILSALCCLHTSNTISKVPSNQNFTSDVSCLQSSDSGVNLDFYALIPTDFEPYDLSKDFI